MNTCYTSEAATASEHVKWRSLAPTWNSTLNGWRAVVVECRQGFNAFYMQQGSGEYGDPTWNVCAVLGKSMWTLPVEVGDHFVWYNYLNTDTGLILPKNWMMV